MTIELRVPQHAVPDLQPPIVPQTLSHLRNYQVGWGAVPPPTPSAAGLQEHLITLSIDYKLQEHVSEHGELHPLQGIPPHGHLKLLETPSLARSTVLMIYLGVLGGNFLTFTIIVMDTHLHSPEYFCKGNLSLVDFGYISVTVPSSIVNSLKGSKLISLTACAAQNLLFIFFGSTEIFFLMVMSYDRHVAILHPLHSGVTMTPHLCTQLAGVSWASGLVYSAVHTGTMFRLPFPESNVIHQYICDVPQIMDLSSSDIQFSESVALAVRKQRKLLLLLQSASPVFPVRTSLLVQPLILISFCSFTVTLDFTEIFKKQKHIGEPGNLPQKELENTSTSDYSSSLSDYENSETTELPEDVPRVGALEMTPPQVWEEREASSSSTSSSSPSSSSTSSSSPSSSASSSTSSAVPACLSEKRCDWWGGLEVLEPASKKTKLVQCVFSHAAQKTSGAFLTPKCQNAFLRRPSYVSPPKRLSDMECISDNNALQGREKAGSAGEPPAPEEDSRAKTPKGLGTLDSGFRCLGCYQVFRSLEVLQEHVENAARERFTCHVFNRAFAQMLSKHKKRARELGGENQDENIYLPDRKRSRSKTSSCM
ncbi:Olfactory Receptor 14I1 [Manis pentadactyla]|nr:Olfactory Receptor 14I1 [Manis pentadactyla]